MQSVGLLFKETFLEPVVNPQFVVRWRPASVPDKTEFSGMLRASDTEVVLLADPPLIS